MTITLTREEAQQVLDTIGKVFDHNDWQSYETTVDLLRARLAQPEPEPPRFPTMLRKMWSGSEVQAWIDEHYTAPPQREWQGLTDEEITALKHNGDRYISSQDFARAIEAKLKEKNT